MDNKIALKKLEDIPEADFSEISENGPYELKPIQLALIKDKSFYDSVEGRNWELVGVVGKVSTKENLSKFGGYNEPFIIASNEFENNGKINIATVSSKKYFSQIFGYKVLAKF